MRLRGPRDVAKAVAGKYPALGQVFPRACNLGHVVTEHKHGLIVESCLTRASKRAEWEAGLAMLANLAPGDREITVAADKAYQEEKFIAGLRGLGVVPLVAEINPRSTRRIG